MKTLRLTIAALCFFGIITACEKEGAIGPQGPLGEQGPIGKTGPKGDKGDTGAKGDKGTANVLSSAWSNYNWNEIDLPSIKMTKVAIPSSAIVKLGSANLNEFLASGGTLLVYGRITSVPVVFSYPLTDGGTFAYNWQYVGTSNEIEIRLSRPDDGPLQKHLFSPEEGAQFRYVLIASGGIISGYKSAKEVNWASMGYEDAKSLLGLKD